MTYEVNVDSDGAALAEAAVRIDEEEFNERKRECRDMEVKFGAREAK